MIVAAYCVFNEEALIAESIRSVKAFVDRFIFIDAAFRSNPLPATHSTDRTREVAERAVYPLPLTYHEADSKMELDAARNLALRLMDDDDWALIIDGDETLLGERDEIRGLFNEIRRRERVEPVGMSVFSSALVFDGHAPAIDSDAYQTLSVVYTRGRQVRLVQASGLTWQLVPNGGSYGMYRDGHLVKAPADPRLVMVNHRTRQTFDAYQNDYVWETALL